MSCPWYLHPELLDADLQRGMSNELENTREGTRPDASQVRSQTLASLLLPLARSHHPILLPMPLIDFPSPARRPRPHQKPRDAATPLTPHPLPGHPRRSICCACLHIVYRPACIIRPSRRYCHTASPSPPPDACPPAGTGRIGKAPAYATTSAHSPVASRNNLESYKEVQEDGQGAP